MLGTYGKLNYGKIVENNRSKKKKDPKKKKKQKNDPNEISHLSRGNNAN